MGPYSLAIQKANRAGWFVSKATGEGAFMVIFPQSKHALSARSDEMMAVYIDITVVFHATGL